VSNDEWREKRHPPPATRHLPYLYCFGCSFAAPEYSLTNKIVIKPSGILTAFRHGVNN